MITIADTLSYTGCLHFVLEILLEPMLVLNAASLFQPAPSPVAANAIYSSNKLPFFDANILATTYRIGYFYISFFCLISLLICNLSFRTLLAVKLLDN